MSSIKIVCLSVVFFLFFLSCKAEDNHTCLIRNVANETTDSACLLIDSVITVSVSYNKTGGNKTGGNKTGDYLSQVSIPLDCDTVTVSNTSYCKVAVPGKNKYYKSQMLAVWGDQDQFLLIIDAGINLNKYGQWNISRITVGVNISAASGTYFPNASRNYTGMIKGYTSDKYQLFGTVDYGKYYICNISRIFNLSMDTAKNEDAAYFKMSVSIGTLKVQVFDSGDHFNFSSSYSRCYQDNNGGPVFIPIVVGSVIGGLVIIVLVSYIVGRFRNRKKDTSGYEKL